MPWKQVPLVFTGASGSEINRIKYQNNVEIGRYDRAHDKLNNYIDFVSKAANAGTHATYGANPGTMIFGMLNGAVDSMKSWIGEGESNLKYLQQKTNELADLEIANNVVVLSIVS